MTQCPDEYTCAACNGTFHRDPEAWSEGQAQEEFLNDFGRLPNEDDVTICDVCYHKLQKILSIKAKLQKIISAGTT